MKKLLLSLGAIASVAAPVAAVVACGATDGDSLPTLQNGLKASALYTYTFSDDMDKGKFISWTKDYAVKVHEYWKNVPSGTSGDSEDKRASIEMAYHKKTQAPAFKFIYNGKTVVVDLSMGDDDQYAVDGQFEMGASLKVLATKLGIDSLEHHFDIS